MYYILTYLEIQVNGSLIHMVGSKVMGIILPGQYDDIFDPKSLIGIRGNFFQVVENKNRLEVYVRYLEDEHNGNRRWGS